jgi:hypothetical protein
MTSGVHLDALGLMRFYGTPEQFAEKIATF